VKNGFVKLIVINEHTENNLAALTLACQEVLQYMLLTIRIGLTDPLFLSKNANKVKEKQ
jgi:hypothetical protein